MICGGSNQRGKVEPHMPQNMTLYRSVKLQRNDARHRTACPQLWRTVEPEQAGVEKAHPLPLHG